MGLSRQSGSNNYPTVMYWVSEEPGDISSFEFVGQKENSRNLPAPGMNYMNFIRDNEGAMYLYGRIMVQGIQSWGFYKYDATNQCWNTIGGFASDVIAAVREKEGDIFILKDGQEFQSEPEEPADKVFAWSWQPNFYNYIRGWGVRF